MVLLLNIDHYTFFREADRLLKILYSEMSFENLIEQRDSFDFSKKETIANIVWLYQKLYPNNYNRLEIEAIIEWIRKKLEKEYHSSDSFYLFFLVAKEIIQFNDHKLFIKFDDLLEWDGFINKIDVKVFVAAFIVQNNLFGENCVQNYYLDCILGHDNKTLMGILKRQKISENHAHMNAASYIEDINWYYFLKRDFMAFEDYEKFIDVDETFRDKGAKTKAKKTDWLQLILKTKYLRWALDMANVHKRKWPSSTNRAYDILHSSCLENDPSFLKHQDEFREYTIELANRLKRSEKQFQLESYAFVEMNFLIEIFNAAYRHKELRGSLYCINLYLSGMTCLKFQFVQDNNSMGFTKFKDKENLKDWFVGADKKGKNDIKRSAFHKYYQEKVVQNVEFRIGPEDTSAEYVSLVKKLEEMNNEEAENSQRKINYGIVIHFIKKAWDKENDGSFHEYKLLKRREMKHQGNVLIEGLCKIQEAESIEVQYQVTDDKKDPKDNKHRKIDYHHKIVGIDTANYEQDNRPELYACLYRQIKAADVSKNEGIRATYHVGEEFPTLANGLRAIDEVLLFCGYQSNDRLGHALALGTEVDKYFKAKRNNVFCKYGEYLDDLVWMYQMIANCSTGQDAPLLIFLEDEYYRVYAEMVSKVTINFDSVSFKDYLDSYFLRGDDPDVYLEILNLKNCRNPQCPINYDQVVAHYPVQLNSGMTYHRKSFFNSEARKLFLQYSFNGEYVKMLRKSFHTQVTKQYVHCVKRVQEILKKKVLDMTVFIEANPTSNRKISFATQYTSLPFLNMNRKYLEEDSNQINLPISINTDDSSIFQTNLVHEYSVVACSLIRDGYEPDKVYDYIEYLAKMSNVHSFVER